MRAYSDVLGPAIPQPLASEALISALLDEGDTLVGELPPYKPSGNLKEPAPEPAVSEDKPAEA